MIIDRFVTVVYILIIMYYKNFRKNIIRLTCIIFIVLYLLEKKSKMYNKNILNYYAKYIYHMELFLRMFYISRFNAFKLEIL